MEAAFARPFLWLSIIIFIPIALLQQFHALSSVERKFVSTIADFEGQAPTANLYDSQQQHGRQCAICLFGLPRAFASIVLPSLVQNVIRPNAKYHCDYFVHYYDLKHEPPGRSGNGGWIRPEEVLLLEEAVHNVTRGAVVKFVNDTEMEFWNQYNPLVERIKTTKDASGNYVYFPWKEWGYEFPLTIINVIKMWHSIQSACNLMQEHKLQFAATTSYSRVAMLRSDVFYLNPFDIYTRQAGVRDDDNEYVVVPGFGRFPVSDRLVYGPAEAIEIWASGRFARIEEHAQTFLKERPGWSMHPERFLAFTLFPAIRNLTGVKDIMEHDTLCFFRVRADESIWISDCSANSANSIQMLSKSNNVIANVERILGRKCGNLTKGQNEVLALACPKQK